MLAYRYFARCNKKYEENNKKSKKGVDKWWRIWYTIKAIGKSETNSNQAVEKTQKKFGKPLDKPATKWYNKQAVDRKVTANRSLKIEQQ